MKEKSKSKKAKNTKTKKVKKSYIKAVKSEMSKVVWPNKKDLVKYTIATIVFVAFFALFFTLIDVAFAAFKGWLS